MFGVPVRLPRFIVAFLTLVALFAPDLRADLNFHMLRSFPLSMCPSGELVQGDDGYFYGVTIEGGRHNGGSLYRLGADGSLEVLHHFHGIDSSPQENAGGTHPVGTLVKGDDGTLYGNTREGGVHGNGLLFSYQPSTGLFCRLHHFDFESGMGRGNLTKGPNDALYGTCSYGGSKGGGTIFRLSKDGTFTILHEFLASVRNPNFLTAERFEPLDPNSIWVGDDGVIYGTTSLGGPVETPGGKFLFTYGTAFRLDPDGTFTLLHEFALNCEHPRICLRASDGNFYGVGGGLYDATVFKMTPAGDVSPVKVFDAAEGTHAGRILLGSDGVLYGTTYYDGAFGAGTVFRVTLAGEYERLYDYPQELYAFPRTGLVEGFDGALYGATTAPELSQVPDAPKEETETAAAAMTFSGSNQVTSPVRVALRTTRPTKRNGAFRIGIRPGTNRSPIVRSETVTVRRVGLTAIPILRNDKDPDNDPLQVKALTDLPEELSANFDATINKLVLSTSTVPTRTAVIGYTVTDGTSDSRGNLVIRPAFAGAYAWKNDAGARLQLALTAKGMLVGRFTVNGQTHKLRASVGLDDTILGAINASDRAQVTANLKVTGAPYQISGSLTLDGTVYEIEALRR